MSNDQEAPLGAAPQDFMMLVPNSLIPGDDMDPQKTVPVLRALFAAMKRNGYLFVDWGEVHPTHTEAWWLPLNGKGSDG